MHYLSRILIIAAVFTFVLNAADGSYSSKTISEDLRFAFKTDEVILERIIKHYDKNRIVVHHNVSSYYVDGYGAIFEVQRFPVSEYDYFNQFGDRVNKDGTKYVWSDEQNTIVKYKSKNSKGDSLKVIDQVNDYLKDLKLAVFEFFADYLSQSNWTKDNEQICIHFDINLSRKISKEYDRDMIEKIVPIAFQATVDINDLKSYNNDNLTIQQFQNKIKFNPVFMNPKSYNYNILGDVLDSAVESIKFENERAFSSYSTHISIPDLGTAYFLVSQYQIDNPNDIVSFFGFLFGGKGKSKSDKNAEGKFTDLLNELKFKLIKSISQYGQKLEGSNDNQYLILFVNIGRYGNFMSRFVLKVDKKYIHQFDNKQISFEEFSNYVQIFEEERDE